jgi:hypothetical protein
MISYTVTTQKTAAQYIVSQTKNYQETFSAPYILNVEPSVNNNQTFTYIGRPNGQWDQEINHNQNTWVYETKNNEEITHFEIQRNSGYVNRLLLSYDGTNYNVTGTEFGRTGSQSADKSFYTDTDGWKALTISNSELLNDNNGGDILSSSELITFADSKSFFTTTYQTTSTKTVNSTIITTGTRILNLPIYTTAGESSKPDFILTFTATTITNSITSKSQNEITYVETYETNLEVNHSLAPRDTATVFCKFQNECVWVPTASDLTVGGPWRLTDIAISHTTDFTAKPLYFTSPLLVIDQENATFPEPAESPEALTENFTTSTIVGNTTRTIWETNPASGLPLKSRSFISPKLTTTKTENTFETFTENNPALTVPQTILGTQSQLSAEVKNFGLTYQNFYSFSYTTTKYIGTWSATFLTQYNGPAFESWEEDGTKKEIFYTNLTVNSAEGVTIQGTNVEQVFIRAFSPCAVSHVETNFRQAWGLHGNDGPQPKNQISFDGSLSLSDFAELLPGVSAPFPSTYSWSTGNSTLSASLAGNAITISTTSGTGSNASTASSTYQFQGDGSAYTEQISDRAFFLNSQGLPALSFFGPHAATESIETRARPGEYVRIVQDSLGAFTLSTLTLETTAASIISDNAILFPGEKSFYTTTGGVPFLTFSRNPVP